MHGNLCLSVREHSSDHLLLLIKITKALLPSQNLVGCDSNCFVDVLDLLLGLEENIKPLEQLWCLHSVLLGHETTEARDCLLLLGWFSIANVGVDLRLDMAFSSGSVGSVWSLLHGVVTRWRCKHVALTVDDDVESVIIGSHLLEWLLG